MNLIQLIQERAREAAQPRQQVQPATVIRAMPGGYDLNLGGTPIHASSALNEILEAGDRVWVVVGYGAGRIIGFLGRGENP